MSWASSSTEQRMLDAIVAAMSNPVAKDNPYGAAALILDALGWPRSDGTHPQSDLDSWGLLMWSATTNRDRRKQLENGLCWLQHIAAVHYMGEAFEPHHMLAIAQLAEQIRDGRELKDYTESMNEAKVRARAMLDALGIPDTTQDI